MTNFSQNDPQWKYKKLGYSNLTIGNAGCCVTAIGNITSLHPDYVNDQLKANNGFSGSAVIWSVAAKLWNLRWNTNRAKPLFYPCVAVTDHFSPRYPTHFFVLLQNGQIIDSLDGQTKNNPYRIIGYRNIGGRV